MKASSGGRAGSAREPAAEARPGPRPRPSGRSVPVGQSHAHVRDHRSRAGAERAAEPAQHRRGRSAACGCGAAGRAGAGARSGAGSGTPGEVLGVRAAHVAVVREGGERAQRGGDAQPLVGAAVHELQQLDGELDVAQPARAELELAARHVLRQRVEHPAAHRLHVLDEVLPRGRLPDQRRDRVRVARAERQVAGRGPGLEQRLELPGLRPPVVVGQVAGQGADQRALPALRPQVRVDGEQRALGRDLLAGLDQAGGEPGGRLERGLLSSPALPSWRAVPARPRRSRRCRWRSSARGRRTCPSRPPRSRTGAASGGQLGAGDRERRLEHRVGQVGEFLGHLVDGGDVGHVAGGQVQQPAVVGGGERARVGRLAGRRSRPAGRRRRDRRRRRAGTRRGPPSRRAGGPPPGPRSSALSSGWRARWSARTLLTPSTAVSRARNAGSAVSAAIRPGVPLGDLREARPGRGRGRRPGRARRAADGRLLLAADAERGELAFGPRARRRSPSWPASRTGRYARRSRSMSVYRQLTCRETRP